MRRNKRKIIAMLLFVFMSLFMFAFANPDGEIELELLKPVMTLDENNPYQMEVHSAIPEFKAIAKDASGNDLEVNITHNINNSVVGTYKITFKAKDNFDNEEVIEREFRVVDTTRPVITLIGRPLVKRLIGYETYTDQGANVTDNYDEATIIYGVQRGANNIVGTYTLRYNHTDNNGNSAFEVVRAIKMLAHGADEDGDGYTNLEEYEAGTDYDDPNDYPDYDKAPTIILDESNVYEMVVYDEVPEFKANATDVADGIVPVVITHNIKPDVVGTYEITFRAVDSLGNEKVLTKEFKVIKRNITVKIDNKTSVYKNPIVELTYTVTSGVEVSTNAEIILSTTATSTSNVGDYPITGTYTNGNYDVTFVDGTYTITKKEIKEDDLGSEFSFTDKSYVYDKTEKEIKVSGLPSDLEVEYDNNKRTNEGEQLVKATITGENYTGEITKTATLEVTKAKVTYTIDNKTSVYKNSIVELTGSVTSGTVYEGDNLNVNLSTTATSTSNVGDYPITGTYTNGNYDVTFVDGTYTITVKNLTDEDLGSEFSFTNKSYVYDKTEKEIKVSGLPSDLEVEYDNNKRTNVGEQLVKATITGANYTGSLTRTATLEVTKASLTFKAEDKTSVYKDSIVGLTYTTTGTNYDGIVPVLSTTATSTSPVGTYPITITASNDNYTITLVNGTYTITAKELTEDELNKLNVKFENKTVDYDGNEHEILVQNKPDWATVEYNNNKGTNVDTYEATAKITGNGNYTGTVTLSAILKINPINPTYEIPTGLIGVKNNKLSTVSLPSGWSWNSPNTEMEIVGNQTFAATFTPVDTQNYNTVTKDLTVYVKDIFTVNFIVDGLTIDTQQVIEGENATAPENPSKAGYTFDGWDKVYTNVMTNLDVNAKWELITYNITYNLDGGSHTGNPTTYNITTPTIILKDASKTGHTFNGWYSENTFTNKVISIEQGTTGNITLYAKFTANQFTITFDSNGGTLVSSITQAYGTTITMPENPTKTNYEFVKWNPAVPETMPANDMTVVAEWKALQIGIVVKEKPNAQLVFTQGRPYNITEYINVYPKYADGTVGTEAIPTSDYTTDFSTTTPGNNKTLTVTQTSTEFVGTITYKVIADTAFQTKFEAKHNPSATGYYVTKRNNWGNYYCTSGCDSGNNVSFVSTTDKILEVIEHYDEKIAVESVKIKYVGDNNYGNSLTPIKNGSYSFVRYSKLSGGSYYDPVRVYKIHDTKTIDLVQVIYERTFSANDKRRFVIIFKYESAGNLEAISEQQL